MLLEKKPSQITEYNSACIAQADSGLRHDRNANIIKLSFDFLQQLVVDKGAEFAYCPTDI
jgi:hypothetical protein